MELLSSKIVAMVLMGAVALFFGLLPIKVKPMILKGEENSRRRRKRERIISALLCFGSGVLIATVFIHMLPETREGFEKSRKLGLLGSDNHEVHEGHLHDYHGKSQHALNHQSGNNKTSSVNNHSLHFHSDKTHREKEEGHVHQHLTEHDDHSEPHNHIGHHGHLDNVSYEHNDHMPYNHFPKSKHEHHEGNENLRKANNDSKSRNEVMTNINKFHHDNTAENKTEREMDALSGNISTNNKSFVDKPALLHKHGIEDEGNASTLAQPITNPFKQTENSATPLKNDTNLPSNSLKVNNIPRLKVHKPKEIEMIENKMLPSALAKENNRSDTVDPKTPVPHHIHGENEEPHFEALSQLPEPLHSEEAHDHSDGSHGYPLAELMICVGFFLIYFIEEMIHKALFKHSEDTYEKKDSLHHSGTDTVDNCGGHSHAHSHVPPFHSHPTAAANGHISLECKEPQIPNGNSITANGFPAETQLSSIQKNMAPRSEWGEVGIDNPVFAGDLDATSWNPKVKNSVLSSSQVSPMPLNDLPKTSTISIPDAPVVLSMMSPEAPKSSLNPPEKIPLKTVVLSNLRSLLVVIALSFHAVFEGMAVGLQEYSKDVWYLFLAIAAHKFVILFCIGLELMVAGTPLVLMVLYMVILALVTPFGIAIGIVVTENSAIGGSEHLLVVTILQGLAGGTLLYVAFLEVLERERSKPGGRIMKFICLVVGFACMASIEAIMGGHSH